MISPVLFRAERLFELGASTGPVLGIDTGTKSAVLGLVREGRTLGQMTWASGSHCANLPVRVEQLLAEGGLRPADLQAVAVGIGPGSFTGLRIGLSYAKGLALATDCAIVGIPTLDSLAVTALACRELPDGSLIRPFIDARKGEIYSALYAVTDAGLEKISAEQVITVDSLRADEVGEVLFVTGDECSPSMAPLGDFGEQVNLLDVSEAGSRGIWIAILGAAQVSGGRANSIESLEPLYVRSPGIIVKPAAQRMESARTGRHYGAQGRGTHSSTCGS